MDHLGIEKHNFFFRDFLGLNLVEGSSYLTINHVQALVLLEVSFFLLEFLHQHVLLIKEKLFTSALQQFVVNFLWQGEDVIERAWLDSAHLGFKLLDGPFEKGLLAQLLKVIEVKNLHDGILDESQVDLEL